MRAVVAALTCSLLVAAGAAAQQRYTVTKIGPLPGHNGSMAADLNDYGQVTGSSDDVLGYVWTSGVIQALPPLEGGQWSQGCGINALGDVVGSAGANDFIQHAVKWSPDGIGTFTMANLGVGPGDYFAVARAINDRGDVIGCTDNGYRFRAAAWTYDAVLGYQFAELPRLPGYPYADAFAVSASGTTIVGEVNTPMTCRAVRWNRVGESWNVTQLAGLPGGATSSAADINAAGLIVGWLLTSDRVEHVVIWDGDNITDLGTLDGKRTFGRGINDAGDVVGETMTMMGIDTAFVRPAGEEIADLNTLLPLDTPWHLRSAVAINNAGQVAGFGDIDGFSQSFLLSPISLWLTSAWPDGSRLQQLVVSGATPGATISFYVAGAGGETVIPGCGQTLDLQSALPLGAVTADAAGRAQIAVPVIDRVSDLGILIQAAELSTCRVSSLVRYGPGDTTPRQTEVFVGSPGGNG